MGKSDAPASHPSAPSTDKATETQTPQQVPNSQGPGTVDTSKNAEHVQHPGGKK